MKFRRLSKVLASLRHFSTPALHIHYRLIAHRANAGWMLIDRRLRDIDVSDFRCAVFSLRAKSASISIAMATSELSLPRAMAV
jgi:hypothetical protein